MIVVDGIKTQLEAPDLDGDGEVGGVEVIRQKVAQDNLIPITQKSELGESLQELNSDEVPSGQKMSNIDMRSRIPLLAFAPLTGVEALISLDFYSREMLPFARKYKRNTISMEGKGRGEIVSMVTGKQERENNGFGDKMKKMLGINEQQSN